MQSVNEELQTINAEMVSKNELLTRVNSDLKNLLDSTEIATIFLDNAMRIKSFTAGMTDIFHLRDGDRGRRVTDITTVLSYPDLEKDAKKVLRTLSVIDKEVSLADEGMTFLMRIRPYRTLGNVIDGVVITFVDITEHEQAAKALRASEQRFSAIVDQATVGVAETDLNGRFVLVNSRYCEMVGRSAEELTGLRMQDITHPEDLPLNVEPFSHLTGEGKPFEIEKRYVRPDGSIVWVHNNVAPVNDIDGRPQHAVAVSLDITERKHADERRLLLLQELNHRVKNTLSIVQSIAMQTHQSAQTPEAFQEAFSSRLVALSRTHDLLTTRNWEGVSLRDLILRELEPYQDGQFAINGEDIHLRPEMALTLGMALHELATNAAKYGALSVPVGRVGVTWEVTNNAGQRHVHLRWIETGGPPVKERNRWGLGSKLIERALAYSLNGVTRLDFAASGVKCTIDAPLS